MVSGIFVKVFGTKNSRELKRMGKLVARVNAFEEQMQALSDDDLKAEDDGVPATHRVRRDARQSAA